MNSVNPNQGRSGSARAAGSTTAAEASSRPGPLARIPLFARLEAAEQEALRSSMQRKKFEANETIFWVGDRGESLYFIESGRVLVTVPNQAGDHVPVATLKQGDIFGEISLLDRGPRTATVRAIEATSVLELSRHDFAEFLKLHPEASLEILSVMGIRQRASNEQIRHIPNPNQVITHTLSPWQRVSDVIATVAASPIFTLFHLAWFGGWIGLNLGASLGLFPSWIGFDPFPFGLLTMVVSLEAIFLSIFVMVSQNRQAERDRTRTDLDYQVNVKAHVEILNLSRRLDAIGEAIDDLRKRSSDSPSSS